MSRVLLGALLLLGALPAGAAAGTAGFDGGAFTYTAAPGEPNGIVAQTTEDCEGLAAPCFSFNDAAVWRVDAPAGCVESSAYGIRCPIPASVTLDLGDRVDIVNDWDGPSTIHGGPDGDLLQGNGGADVLNGDSEMDALVGGPGDDVLDGGRGEDTLESPLGGMSVDQPLSAADSAGSDVLRGGDGVDTVSYEPRTDPLSLSLDGRANDGAPGENDEIAADVEWVQGGSGDDSLTGSERQDILRGLDGDDTLRGGAGQDEVDGGEDADVVLGEAGDDAVAGGGGEDVADGGAGKDSVYGDYQFGCGVHHCIGGADEIRARDGEADGIECNEGEDRAAVDRVDRLAVSDTCEHVRRAGGGSQRSTCDILMGKARAVCVIAERAARGCGALRGARAKSCMRRAVRRAGAGCRARYRGRARVSCVRSVRRLLGAARPLGSAAARRFQVTLTANQEVTWSKDIAMKGCDVKGAGSSSVRVRSRRVRLSFRGGRALVPVTGTYSREGTLESCRPMGPPDCGAREYPAGAYVEVRMRRGSAVVRGPYTPRIWNPFRSCPGSDLNGELGVPGTADTGAAPLPHGRRFTVEGGTTRTVDLAESSSIPGLTGTEPVTTTIRWRITFKRL